MSALGGLLCRIGLMVPSGNEVHSVSAYVPFRVWMRACERDTHNVSAERG